jgi:pimeloyl-ACP methyl ester carboxylesterase
MPPGSTEATRGSGLSFPTLPVQVDLLDQLLKLWDLRDVLVIGHDIGGGVAQPLAPGTPDRVTGLLLVDSIAYDPFPELTVVQGGRHFLPEDHPGVLGDLLAKIVREGANHGS